MLESEKDRYLLTAEQYNELYCQAEQAMRELEELQLSMGEGPG